VKNDQGVAVIIALLMAVLLGAIAAALVALTTTETLISASFRHSQEASHGAEAALERALHDLATLPDWSAALAAPPVNVTSSFIDGSLFPTAPDGSTLDLTRLTLQRQRESDARDGPDVFGADSPQWRLYAHAPIRNLLLQEGILLPIYVVVWVADDGSDGDGDPTRDANGRIVVRAEAFGSGGARRAVEAAIGKSATGALRLLVWHEAR